MIVEQGPSYANRYSQATLTHSHNYTTICTSLHRHMAVHVQHFITRRLPTFYLLPAAGASLGHDDWEVLIFFRRKFTIYPTDQFLASRIPTKPSSQQQGTRDLPDKGNIFSRQHTQQPTLQVLKTRQTPACVISKLFHFYLFFKKIIMGV